MGLPIVEIAVGGNQYLGFNLAKTVDNPFGTKVRRTELQTAPMDATASIEITASGILGR